MIPNKRQPEDDPSGLLLSVKSTVEKFSMLKPGEAVLVGLSGGADSVSLTLALLELGYKVSAVHVDHMMRGTESDRDREFCREFCKKFGIELFCERVNVPEYARKTGLSPETAARELRYRAFEKHDLPAKIATAHNADDCLETALFNFARGTGVRGLCGVPPVRGRFIRPLISTPRAEAEQYLKLLGQEYVTDSTNLLPDCSRNMLRLLAIPELKKVNPDILGNYLRSRDNFLETEEYFSQLAESALKDCRCEEPDGRTYRTVGLEKLHPALKHRVFGEILRENGVEVSRDKTLRLEELCFYKPENEKAKSELSKGLFALCKNGVLRFEKGGNDGDKNFSAKLNFGEEGDFLGRKVLIRVTDVSQAEMGDLSDIKNINKNFTNPVADYDKIKGTVIMRSRRPGDKIRLAGRGFTSEVKKLLSGSVPEEKRHRIVMLEDREGLFFAEGAGPAERVKADSSTKRLAEIIISGRL